MCHSLFHMEQLLSWIKSLYILVGCHFIFFPFLFDFALVLLLVFTLLCNFTFTLLVVWHCFLFVFFFLLLLLLMVLFMSLFILVVLLKCWSLCCLDVVHVLFMVLFKMKRSYIASNHTNLQNLVLQYRLIKKFITYVTWMKVLIWK